MSGKLLTDCPVKNRELGFKRPGTVNSGFINVLKDMFVLPPLTLHSTTIFSYWLMMVLRLVTVLGLAKGLGFRLFSSTSCIAIFDSDGVFRGRP